MRTHDTIDRAESISTIIVNIGTMISWLLTIFTAFVLTSQPKPISLPGILELGTPYKLLFLSSVFLGFVQLLRKGWENQKRRARDIEGTFGSYVYGSVIKFKRPLVFIGFLVILGITAIVAFTAMPWLGPVLVFIGFIAGPAFFVTDGHIYVRRLYDDEYRKRWLRRIRTRLYEYGCTVSVDFQNLPTTLSEINWALKLYFDRYEFEQDLVFSKKYIEKGLETYEICEIRFENVPSRLPKQVNS